MSRPHLSRDIGLAGRPIAVVVAVAACLMGCETKSMSLMPLSVHRSWIYQVETGLDMHVEQVEVTRPVAVAGTQGFELSGPLGVTRMGWRGQRLLVDSATGVRFNPPLPILALDAPTASWSGTMSSIGRLARAKATTTRSHETLTLGIRKVETTVSKVELRSGRQVIYLSTWFEPGVGIVKQQQGSDRQVDIRLTMVSGS